MTVSIREAKVEDSDQIHLVSVHLGYQKSSNEESIKRLTELIASTSDYVWVYEDDRNIVAWLHLFVSCRVASPKFAEIGGLVVDQSCRRSGIGKKLVEHAIQWSQLNDMPLRVRCNTNREESNTFYESMGFECKKTQKIHQIDKVLGKS